MDSDDNFPKNSISRPELIHRTWLDKRTIVAAEKRGELTPFRETQNVVLYEYDEVKTWLEKRNAKMIKTLE